MFGLKPWPVDSLSEHFFSVSALLETGTIHQHVIQQLRAANNVNLVVNFEKPKYIFKGVSNCVFKEEMTTLRGMYMTLDIFTSSLLLN